MNSCHWMEYPFLAFSLTVDLFCQEIFRLIVASFENLSDIHHPLYLKSVSILERFAKVRLFLVMVDLECYHMIVDMFKHFFKSIR